MAQVGDFFDDIAESSFWDTAGDFLTGVDKATAVGQKVSQSVGQMLGQSQTAIGNGGTSTPSATKLAGTPANPSAIFESGNLKWLVLIALVVIVFIALKKG